MTMNDEYLNQLYSDIAQIVAETIPEEWEKFYLYGEVVEGKQTSRFYYYPMNRDEPIYSHNIPELFTMSEEEYYRLWNNLLDTMQELKKAFVANKQEPWTNFTMIVDKTGKMNMDFSYEDLSNTDPHERRTIWNYELLGIMPKSNSGRQILQQYLEEKEKEGNS